MPKNLTVESAQNLHTGRARRVDQESAITFGPPNRLRRVTAQKLILL